MCHGGSTMPYQRFTRLILLWLIPLALLFPLRWSVMRARSRQFSQAVNNWNLTKAIELEQMGVQKDLASDLRFQILKGNIAGVETLIAQGADVNFQDEEWSSPLCF